MTKHLILGGTGGIGYAVVKTLLERKETTRTLVRNRAKIEKLFQVKQLDIVEGDVEDPSSLKSAMEDIDIVYNCVNLPYDQWSRMRGVVSNTINAAKKTGAKLVFPGNVYVYGRAQTNPVKEDHPLAAHTKKGRLRIELEAMMMDTKKRDEVPSLILRYPDYYGQNVVNQLMLPIFQAALKGGSARWVGSLKAEHEFIYNLDAAKAMVEAASHDDAYGEVSHVPGPSTISSREWIEIIFRIAGKQSKIQSAGSAILSLMGLFDSQVREVKEMLYLFQEPLILDGTKFRERFGDYPSTPYEQGIRETLDWVSKNYPPN